MNSTVFDNFMSFGINEEKKFRTFNMICNTNEDVLADYKQVLLQATMSIKILSKSYYKETPYLEACDIDQIKNALGKYKSESKDINDFKNTLINDLTDFQNQIETNHTKKLNDLDKEKDFYERQIKVFEAEKQKLVINLLSKILWPYNSKTHEYDNKIAALQAKVQNCEIKLYETKNTKPTANEKDILIYQLHLKEKYSNIAA